LGWAWPWAWVVVEAEGASVEAAGRPRSGVPDNAAGSTEARHSSLATKRWSEESALVVATGSSGT